MTTPAPGGSGSPEEERKGLSKFVRRASKVFRRRSSARASISGPSDLTQAPGAGEIIPPPVTSPAPIEETAAEDELPISPPAPASDQQTAKITAIKLGNFRLATTAADSSAILEERARALFAKYGCGTRGEANSDANPSSLPSLPDNLRRRQGLQQLPALSLQEMSPLPRQEGKRVEE
ncbi:MAG: hypothetical protein Q9226_007552 [Calogaya cf. arnoldii]